MVTANQVKSGTIIDVNGAAHVVASVVKQTPSARGANTLYKIRARDILTGNKTDLTCKGDDPFQQPNYQNREVQYLYRSGDICSFMDLESYEQYDTGADGLEEQLPYLTEGMEDLRAVLIDDRLVGINLPDVVEQELEECDPAIKGASATARTKPATTGTGLIVQVPEYMSSGEVVRIDTRTGKFLGRA